MENQKRILIVDDDKEFTSSLSEFFEFAGYPVVVAHTGKAGLKLLRETPIFLALIDLLLPDVEGTALMREAQRLDTPPDVVIVTGHAALDSAIAAVEAGAAGYIVKPVDLSSLGALVGKLFERRRLILEGARLNEEARARTREVEERSSALETLHIATRSLSTEHEINRLLQRIVETARELIGSRYAALAVFQNDGRVRQLFTAGFTPEERELIGALPEGKGLLGQVFRHGQTLRLEDLTAHPAAAGFPPGHAPMRGFLGAPIRFGQEILGALYLTEKSEGFTAEDERRLNTFCADAAVALENARLYERVERDRRRLEVLYDVSRRLAAVHDTDQVLALIVEEAARLLGAEAAGLRLLEGGDLVLRARTEAAAAFVSRLKLKVGESLSGLIVSTGKPVVVEDLGQDTRYDPAHKRGALEHGFHGFAGVPLLSRGRAIGALNVYTKSRRRFELEEISLLSAFADQVSLAIEKARLLSEAEAREREATRLYEITGRMASSLDLDRILDLIAAKTVELLGSDASGIFIHNEKGGGLDLHRGFRLDDEEMRSLALALGNGVAWRAFKERCLVWTRDRLTDPTLGPVAEAPTGAKAPRAYLAAPMISRGEAHGVLMAYSLEPRDFTPKEVRLLSTLAHHAAAAIDNSRLYEAASAQAEALSEKNKQLSFLNRQVAVALTSSLSLNDVLNQIMSHGISVSGAKATCVAFYDEPSGRFKEWLTQGLSDHFVKNIAFRPGGLADETFTSRTHVLSNDHPETKHKLSRLAREEGIRAFICLPLIGHERRLGVIYFYREDRDTFTPDEIELLTTFAHLAAGAIDNSRLFEEAQTQRVRLTQIFESTSDGIMLVGRSGQIVSANRRAGELLALNQAEVVGRSLNEVLTRLCGGLAGCDPISAALPALIDDPDRVSDGDLEIMAPAKRILRWVGQPTKDSSGAAVGLTLTFQDVTQEREVSQMKSDFVSFVTHQLRTPLSGIKWLLELAVKEPSISEETLSYIQDSRESAERLISLVNDLLDISRLEGGRLTVTPQEVHLGELTRSVLDEVSVLIQDKGHRLSVAGMEEVQPVMVDPQLFRQVVLNLVSNAIKYTPAGGEIAVRMGREDGAVSWAISDSGIGIPLHAQRRLFEKFYRAENAPTMETEGTGLGLYLVRLIVERFGGRVWCESEEGKGSTFLFTLPDIQE